MKQASILLSNYERKIDILLFGSTHSIQSRGEELISGNCAKSCISAVAIPHCEEMVPYVFAFNVYPYNSIQSHLYLSFLDHASEKTLQN